MTRLGDPNRLIQCLVWLMRDVRVSRAAKMKLAASGCAVGLMAILSLTPCASCPGWGSQMIWWQDPKTAEQGETLLQKETSMGMHPGGILTFMKSGRIEYTPLPSIV